MRQFLISNSKDHRKRLAQVSRLVLGVQLWHDVTGKSSHDQQTSGHDGDDSKVAVFTLQDVDATLLDISSKMATERSTSTKLYRLGSMLQIIIHSFFLLSRAREQ